MTSRITLRTLLLAVSSTLVFAASPVATISSSGSFELRGVSVKTEGIPSWPVMAGDEIKTQGSSAMILFRDGSSVMLSEQAFARIEKSGNKVSFRLLNGSMQVTAAQGPAVNFYNNKQPVEAKAGTPVRVSTNGLKVGRLEPAFPHPPPPPASGQ